MTAMADEDTAARMRELREQPKEPRRWPAEPGTQENPETEE